MRPFQPTDLPGYNALRSEPSVMKWTGQERVDVDIAESEKHLQAFLSPAGETAFNFAMIHPETEDFVGAIGIRFMVGSMGWPEVGYMLRPQYWGSGYATEACRAFLEHWWSLPRQEKLVSIEIDQSTVSGAQDGDVVQERLTALTDDDNAPSKKILTKLGFAFTGLATEIRPDGRPRVGCDFILLGPTEDK